MKNKRLEIVTCRLAGGGHRPECPPPLDPGLGDVISLVKCIADVKYQMINV